MGRCTESRARCIELNHFLGPGLIMRQLLRDMVDVIYPPVCVVCRSAVNGGHEFHLCQTCRGHIPCLEAPFCPRCGRPYAHAAQFGHLCGECMSRPPHYRRARSAGHYRDTLRTALHLFKYELQQRLATTLGSLMVERLPYLALELQYDLVLSVPLHPRRLRARGFNQALCLAAAISHHLGVSLDRFSLQRVRWTRSQVGLSESERACNVKNAFVIVRPHAVKNKTILLIDDIYTSGSTVGECARVLVEAGAEAIDVLTLARVT